MCKFSEACCNPSKIVFTPWPFRPKGYCRCPRLSACPPVRPSVNFSLFAHNSCYLSWNHQICTKHAFWDFSAGIENMVLWSWHSRSFWLLQFRLIGNLACRCENLLHIWAGITKFAPNMHPGILLAGIKIKGHWPWPSKSFCHFDSEF